MVALFKVAYGAVLLVAVVPYTEPVLGCCCCCRGDGMGKTEADDVFAVLEYGNLE